jgi:hypothetical protein
VKKEAQNTLPRSDQHKTNSSIRLNGIGEVMLQWSARAKNLRLRVDKNGVTAILPIHYSEQAALSFIEEKRNWIARSLAKQKEILEANTVFTENTSFNTRFHTLTLERHNRNTIKSLVAQNRIRVWFPEFAAPEDERIQKVVRRAIEEAWRVESKKYLPARVAELARKHNFIYKRISIKNAKSRWGSCSAENNINLNLQLMRLPEHLIDYVILHELVHTTHKHHRPGFWNKLEEVLPGARKFDKELNRYHLRFW